MRSDTMVASMLAAALLGASCVSSTSTGLSRLWGGQEGAASAVLSADGAATQGDPRSADEVPTCLDPCETYSQGVTEETDVICITDGLCSQTGCGTHGHCRQKFHDECNDECSEWGDADWLTLNVCQNKKDSYKCTNGEKWCTTDNKRCKQKRISECYLFCDGYKPSNLEGVEEPDMDSYFVCQSINIKTEGFGQCMSLPCDTTHHNSKNYDEAQVCIQTHAYCSNNCVDGSDKPNHTTVCYDEWTGKCENHLKCPMHMTRCQPALHHQNLTNVDKEADGENGYGLSQKAARSFPAVPPAGPGMKMADYRAMQQKARIEAILKGQQKAVMRRDSAI